MTTRTANDGLSPRVRGNPYSAPATRPMPRSIPACAGEPLLSSARRQAQGVYPRVCGGTFVVGSLARAFPGLSPRVRGNPNQVNRLRVRKRSIPACAGEPRPSRLAPSAPSVYPRVCGGTSAAACPCPGTAGLSPRVRGNLEPRHINAGQRRSIPACAGEPTPPTPMPCAGRVYPRVCGGTTLMSWSISRPRGLSPRVRGNPTPPSSLTSPSGSIPACAGEPSGWRLFCRSTRVYPRVCGGTRRACPVWSSHKGLSPRVRGNRDAAQCPRCGAGSIPACAGEPADRRIFVAGREVYPRVCGGTWTCCSPSGRCIGLSPRVRGNRAPSMDVANRARSIPACAGEPARCCDNP